MDHFLVKKKKHLVIDELFVDTLKGGKSILLSDGTVILPSQCVNSPSKRQAIMWIQAKSNCLLKSFKSTLDNLYCLLNEECCQTKLIFHNVCSELLSIGIEEYKKLSSTCIAKVIFALKINGRLFSMSFSNLCMVHRFIH